MDYYLQEKFHENGLDMTKEQMVVLARLWRKDGLNQNELAFLTLRDKSSLTRLLSKMEKKGYIIKKQSDVDKRANHIYLTSEGRDVLENTMPLVAEHLSKMEQDITKEEIEQMINTLKKIQFNFTSQDIPL